MSTPCPNCGHPVDPMFTITPLAGAHRGDCRCATCRPDLHVLYANPVQTYTVTALSAANAAALPAFQYYRYGKI